MKKKEKKERKEKKKKRKKKRKEREEKGKREEEGRTEATSLNIFSSAKGGGRPTYAGESPFLMY